MAKIPAPIFSAEKDSYHYYTADGKPCHEVLKSDGNGTRPTRITDARKLKLFPSVTTYTAVVHKPELDRWKMNQCILAAERYPRSKDENGEIESDYKYTERIKDEAFKQTDVAKELGTAIHLALENYHDGTPIPDRVYPYVRRFLRFFEEQKIEVIATERVVVNHAEGYAGCVDFVGKRPNGRYLVWDYKSRKTKEGEGKLKPYDGQGSQLAAYACGIFGEEAVLNGAIELANIYISTTDVGRFDYHEHKDYPDLIDHFKGCCLIWRALKKYDPRMKGYKPANPDQLQLW